MRLCLDAGALVKRYVKEEGSQRVREVMAEASSWHMNRIGSVETSRALGLGTDGSPMRYFEQDWRSFGVIETDERLARHAFLLAVDHRLKTLDAIHLASALALPADGLILATWDRQLHRAAMTEGLEVVPGEL